jgi:hypothetical protein
MQCLADNDIVLRFDAGGGKKIPGTGDEWLAVLGEIFIELYGVKLKQLANVCLHCVQNASLSIIIGLEKRARICQIFMEELRNATKILFEDGREIVA